MSLVVVGTGTEIGKTITCAVLLARYSSHFPLAYWKPVATGSAQGRDTLEIMRLCGHQAEILQESYLFEPPVSPHLAARLAKKRIRPERIIETFSTHRKRNPGRALIIEGIGGLLVPLTSGGYLLADLIQELALPCLLVASTTLGTINHTLLSIEAMKSRDLQLVGVVLNGPENRENRRAIHKFGHHPIIGHIHPLHPLSPKNIGRAARGFDRKALLKSYLKTDQG
jgi:dethiobiotin synthase